MITSGGGFSNYYLQPTWQSEVVSDYFSMVTGTSKAPVSGYNRAGRGYPDVALAATNYLITVGGRQYAVSGTSAAAPVMAGMVSLVNAERLAAGRSPLGWINPALYRGKQFFTNDITVGDNKCTASLTNLACCAQGFNAAVGWDPATGLGSINFTPFMNYFMDLVDVTLPYTPPTTPTPAFRRRARRR